MKWPKISVGKNTGIGGALLGAPGTFIGSQIDNAQSKKAADEEAARIASENQHNKNASSIMGNYLNDPGGSLSLSADANERAKQAENLSQVGTMTGQTIFDTGRQNKDYLDTLQGRRAGTDLTAQFMKDQRNRNMASMGRQFAGRGVAGGVAAAGMMGAQMQADSQVGRQMQERGDALENEFRQYVNRQQKITGEALAAGSDRGLADKINVEAGEGITLICTELKRQNILPLEVQTADHYYGIFMSLEYPTIMRGYHVLAKPVVAKMKTSKSFTKLISVLTIPWAYHIAGKSNIVGAMVMAVGLPLCALVGWLTPKKCEA